MIYSMMQQLTLICARSVIYKGSIYEEWQRKLNNHLAGSIDVQALKPFQDITNVVASRRLLDDKHGMDSNQHI